MATLTHEKDENLGPVTHENIIMEILFTWCSAKISYHENFHVYGTLCSHFRYELDVATDEACAHMILPAWPATNT